jgi:hypothetical protein
VHGVAFCLQDGAAFYVPLATCSSSRASALWQRLSAILRQAGTTKVTYALKHQLQLLASPPPGCGCDGVDLGDDLVDVRVAMWMFRPDSSRVLEGGRNGMEARW